MKLKTIFTLLILIGVFTAAYPRPHGYVNDFAGILSSSEKAELEGMISNFERNTTIEIAVVTISSLNGTDIETYSVELFEQWGIGKRNLDNGVLIVVAPNERQTRIEVGYGLEGNLTDLRSYDIIQNYMLPQFREGRYGQGLRDGVQKIMIVTSGKGIDPAPSSSAYNQEYDAFSWCCIVIVIFVFLIIITMRSNARGGGRFYPMGRSSYGGSGGFGGGGSFGGGRSGGGGASGRW